MSILNIQTKVLVEKFIQPHAYLESQDIDAE